VTDPNNIESEEVLIARARAIHPEVAFGDTFESRFRKGQGKSGGAVPVDNATTEAKTAGRPIATSSAPASGPVSAFAEAEVNYLQLPEIDSWNIPMRCFKCNQVHDENVKSFMIGNVIFCPHCYKSTVVRDNLNYHIRTLLKDAYERWQKEQAEFAGRRDRERAEFLAHRAKEAESFEQHQQRGLEQIRQQLGAIGENYDAPGKPFKKGSRFGWA
jgi:hypothetical protein